MDYDTLYTLIPKEPKKWQIQDVLIWLDFIGLSQLSDKFISQSIDGSILELLEDKDLDEELQITQKIVKKKILNWLNVGLKEYRQFISEKKQKPIPNETIKEQSQTLQKEQIHLNNQEGLLQNSVKSNNGTQMGISFNQNFMSSLPLPANQNQAMEEEIQIQQQPQVRQPILMKSTSAGQKCQKFEHQLILQPMENQQNNFYCIKELGAKIGRHSSNQILILEENISRYHAEIQFGNGIFLLHDIGSTTGTYIKIQKKLEVELNMLIELGSNLFQINNLETLADGQYLLCVTIIEGPNQEEQYELKLNDLKPNVIVGRKNTADVPFQDDHHLSNLHAKFNLIDNKIYIEDYSSTNGYVILKELQSTWLRLSPESVASQPYPLQPSEQHIIRIGTTNQYMCHQNSISIVELPPETLCIICCEKERDALYLPCKHNTACLKCSKTLVNCPICRVKIQEQIRIYKN